MLNGYKNFTNKQCCLTEYAIGNHNYKMKVRLLSLLCLMLCSTLYSPQRYAQYVQEIKPITPYSPEIRYSKNTYKEQWFSNLCKDVVQDYKHYLSTDRLWLLGGAFGAAALIGNTNLDNSLSHHWQSDIRNKNTDRFFKMPQRIGGFSYYYGPIYLASVGIGHLTEHTLLGNALYHWGYRSFRTFLLGGPQQALFTYLIGSGRPNREESSHWKPFKQNTGVSGHAFYGAIPFLTAAMMTDPPVLRYTMYALSTLPGLSRINSNYHYTSQVILAWSMAYLSAVSVYDTDSGRNPKFQVQVQPRSDGAIMQISMPF